MSEISAALGDSGGRHSITWRSRKLYANNLKLGLLESYCKWLFEKAKAALQESRVELGEERYNAKLEKLVDDWGSGQFDFTNPKIRASMETLSGGTKLIALVLEITPDEAFELMQEMPHEAKMLLQTLKREGMPEPPSPKIVAQAEPLEAPLG